MLTNPLKFTKNSISSRENLCKALRIPDDFLATVLALPPDDRYTKKDHVKKAGGISRPIYNPHRFLRRIQKKINIAIFSNNYVIRWPHFIYGSVPNQTNNDGYDRKDYVSCAGRHCGAKSLLKVDVSSFFDNIHQDIVFSIFKDFLNYEKEVSEILTNLCCHNSHLVQGGLTSSYIASLCLWDIEGKVVERLNRKGLTYTRLVDDITVSSKSLETDFTYALKIISDMLTTKDLPINESKTRIYRTSTEPLTVHGLRVSFSTPRLPSDEVGRIRASVRNLESLAAEPSYRTSHGYRHDYNRCMGRVNKLHRVEHNQHKPLLMRLRAIRPLPSRRDVNRAKDMVARLEKDYDTQSHTHWYKSRFHRVTERLIVLDRIYTKTSTLLRSKLKKLRPVGE
ncbi:RNA-directed DNA polymerase [Pseudomonas sp. VS40]|uniref:reverse transcriptase family protein n=1 Tax=unclassified Pseudomonas TaxID=196821 RepID=UPI001BDE6760|nr:RNA-directed DNA polymerase [Pseudomonas sp. VS40]MBT1274303.1 RNA-directed DNA polymerase [Pseudomonas sp. VS59]